MEGLLKHFCLMESSRSLQRKAGETCVQACSGISAKQGFSEVDEILTWLTYWAIPLIVKPHCCLYTLDRSYRIDD
jgi:hypothetical protein